MQRIAFDVGDCRMVAWRVTGTRPAVVCVHGAGVSSRELLPMLGAWDGSREAWSVDLPGFGGSSGPILDLHGLADAVVGWMDQAELDSAYLVGVSFGCQIIADVAVRRSERVLGIALVGPTTDPLARSLPRQVWRWLRGARHEPRGLGPLTFRDYRDAGLRHVAAAFRESIEDSIADNLPHIGVPALVVRGENDVLVPQAWAEQVTRLLQHGRLVVWPDAAHTVPFADPAGVAKLIDKEVCGEAGPRGRVV